VVSKPQRPLSFRPREQFEIDTVLPGTTLLEEWVPPSRGHAIAGRRQSLREAASGRRFSESGRAGQKAWPMGASHSARNCVALWEDPLYRKNDSAKPTLAARHAFPR
jgi:hypothetical protein